MERMSYTSYSDLELEIQNLEQENKSLKNELMEDMKTETKLNEEIKKLKSDLAYERTMLDNVKAEYESLQNDIKKLEEERDFFKEQAILWRKDYKNEYEKNEKLNVIIDSNNSEQKADWEHIEELEEENRKLKERIEELEKEIEELNKMMLFETELEK